jgi:methanogenic corrinoid protein MtbC1
MIDHSSTQAAFVAALRNGDEQAARAIVEQARADGVDVASIYFDIFTPSMITIGELWERNELSVAEEHLATAITERLIGQLSASFDQPLQGGGNVVLGCVIGERHTLGLRMLSDLFRAAGWRVLYLGADVPNADWTRLALRFDADLVAISASQPRYVAPIRELIGKLRAALPELTIMVGGAVFGLEPLLWQDVGADVYHPDPQTAVNLATAAYARRASAPEV